MVKKFELGWEAEERVNKPCSFLQLREAWKRLAECSLWWYVRWRSVRSMRSVVKLDNVAIVVPS